MTSCENQSYGEDPPFQLQIYERVGKYVILVCKRTNRANQCFFITVKNSIKSSGFVIYSYLKDSVFIIAAVIRDPKFKPRYVKRAPKQVIFQ